MTSKIYLTGGWGYGNKGDNVILMAMLNSLKENIPSYELFITSFSPDELKRMHSLSSQKSIHRLLTTRFLKNPLFLVRIFSVWFWRVTKKYFNNPIMICPSLRKHLDLIKNSDVVLMAGGGYFNDAWKDALPSRLLEIEIASYFNKKIMLYGQSIGPFSKESCEGVLRDYLSGVSRVTFRDIKSEQTLRLAQFDELKMKLTADEVNLLPPRNYTQPKAENFSVGVMVQHFRKHEGPTGSSSAGWIDTSEKYYEQIAIALEELNKLKKVHFIIIPSTTWDQSSCNKVARKLNEKKISNFTLLNNPNVNDFVSACQTVDLMISTNMHPIIIASTMCKPSIAISYHYKLDDFMDSIGMSEFTSKIDDFTAEWLVNNFEKITSNYGLYAERVKDNHLRVQELAKGNISILKDLINSN